MFIELINIELKFISDPKWMDKRKQRAFYVDFDKNNSSVIVTPQDEYEFSNDDVQLVINSHRWFIEYWREIDLELRKRKRLPREFVQYRQTVREMVKSFKLDDNV